MNSRTGSWQAMALVAACLIGSGAASPARPPTPAPVDSSTRPAEDVRDPAILWRFDSGG